MLSTKPDKPHLQCRASVYIEHTLFRLHKSLCSEAALVITDELPAYTSVAMTHPHASVNHAKHEWVRGQVHTNTIENFWSLFKRGLIGSFHKVSVKHLPRYLSEFTYRFNNREAQNLFSETLSRMLSTSTMPYSELVSDQEP